MLSRWSILFNDFMFKCEDSTLLYVTICTIFLEPCMNVMSGNNYTRLKVHQIRSPTGLHDSPSTYVLRSIAILGSNSRHKFTSVRHFYFLHFIFSTKFASSVEKSKRARKIKWKNKHKIQQYIYSFKSDQYFYLHQTFFLSNNYCYIIKNFENGHKHFRRHSVLFVFI